MNGVMGGSVEGIEGATGVNGVDGAEGIEDVTVVDGTEGIDLYLLAGVKTWPSYFQEPARRLRQMSLEAGYAVAEVQVLYPYGDHTFPMLRQVRQVARDVARRLALGADPLPPEPQPRRAHTDPEAQPRRAHAAPAPPQP